MPDESQRSENSIKTNITGTLVVSNRADIESAALLSVPAEKQALKDPGPESTSAKSLSSR